MTKRATLITNGKAIPWEDDTPGLWTYASGGPMSTAAVNFKTVAFLYGIIDACATACMELPLFLDGEPIDDTDLSLDMDIRDMIYQCAIGMHLYGGGYYMLERNRIVITGARWAHPSTMHLDLDGDTGDLKSFTRQIKNNKWHYEYDPKDKLCKTTQFKEGPKKPGGLGWVWKLDDQEIGPGTPTADVVKDAADVLRGIDRHAALFFKHGAIDAYLVQTDTDPPKEEKDAFKARIRRVLYRGLETAFNIEVLPKSMTLTKIGTALKDTAATEVDLANQKDICVAFRTPYGIATGDSNNRSVLDRLTSTWLLMVIAPQTRRIVKSLNHHIFETMGKKLEVRPQSVAVNQEDEAERAAAVQTLVAAGETLPNAYRILGYTLPDDYEEHEEPAVPQEQPVTVPAQETITVSTNGNGRAAMPMSSEKSQEIAQFKRWITKRLKAGKPTDPAAFESVLLTAQEKSHILWEAGAAKAEPDSPFVAGPSAWETKRLMKDWQNTNEN